MPSLKKDCSFAVGLKSWLIGDSGGSKSNVQATQITIRVLKFLKFCISDTTEEGEISKKFVEYNLTNIPRISDFVQYLQDDWKLRYSGVVGYLGAIEHAIDYLHCNGGFEKGRDILHIVEIYVTRTKKSLSKKMPLEWNKVLDIDYLEKQGCWATFQDMQSVIPFHKPRFLKIIENATIADSPIRPADLSFATHYITAMLFLSIKATRPMTYQFLTVSMVNSIGENGGTIDQTLFKTMDHYGFDSLVFSKDEVSDIKNYIRHIRVHFEPVNDYLLLTKNGKQLSQLSTIFGNMVYDAIGKYIHPTRLRQIIETESAANLTCEDQAIISEDQKHSSHVAKVFYKKQRSRDVAVKAKKALTHLAKNNAYFSTVSLSKMNVCDENDTKATEPVADVKWEEPTVDVKKKIPFTKEEDTYLKMGIKKYGWGSWSNILRDPHYTFNTIRKPQTLARRATLRKYKFGV